MVIAIGAEGSERRRQSLRGVGGPTANLTVPASMCSTAGIKRVLETASLRLVAARAKKLQVLSTRTGCARVSKTVFMTVTVECRAAQTRDVSNMAELIARCNEGYKAWAPAGVDAQSVFLSSRTVGAGSQRSCKTTLRAQRVASDDRIQRPPPARLRATTLPTIAPRK